MAGYLPESGIPDFTNLIHYSPDSGPVMSYKAVSQLFLVCLLFWFVTYRTCSLLFLSQNFSQYPPDSQKKLKSLGPGYLYSTINAVICIYFGYMVFVGYLGEDELCQTANLQCSSAETVNLSFIGGIFLMTYLIHDLFVVWQYPPELGQSGWDVFIHHFVFIFCTVAGTRAMVMPFAYSWLSLCEISTIPLNVRWLTISYGMGDSFLYHLSSYTFVLAFFAFRVVLYSWGLWDMMAQINAILVSLESLETVRKWCGYFILILIFAGWFLQLYWFFFGILPLLFRRGAKKQTKGAKQD
jgi:hypothetical protein